MSQTITVFTTMKNEGPYMLEWVAYHRSLGVDHFVIFTNDCEDGTDEIARRLQALGVATHVDNAVGEGGNPQHQMLRRARRQKWVKRADWLLCLDVDEFWNIRCADNSFGGLIEAVEQKAGQQVDAISFAWRLFGSSGNVSFEDRPVTQAFSLGDKEFPYHSGRAYGLKTLFRNNGKFTRFGPHRPKGFDEEGAQQIAWSDAGGNLYPASDVGWRAWRNFEHSFGRIHHYSVRSLEGFLIKRDRGRTNHIKVDQGQSYWQDMNANKISDSSIMPLAERAAPMLAEFKADAELSRLHAQACDWHRAKISEIKTRPDWVEFRSWLADNLV
ncbi:glycosyltransferase family 2 protein [Ruegeria sp. HKCCD7255]|uniref:glycosyltransferase family 2 protein n=1 Tax=Ruegeria sp. HKCCD7255 TaxID=2683004 RepID=UPI0014882667|nr:glycosyltransferase family 2 protein [Ruegeria sp. HKCCD7255]